MAAFLTQGLTAFRDNDQNLISHGGVSTDNTAFSAGQNTLNPGGGTNYITTVTAANVDAVTTDYSFVVGSAEFGGNVINTIGILEGPAATNALSRAVRSFGIGVEPSGDTYTIAVRVINSDQTS